ncbi:hypothetical protein FACS189476_00220 [Spirochaetia bacterium]|nr:hypothetical protein FACS189476_00220 [Spirochaetia bacterium]
MIRVKRNIENCGLNDFEYLLDGPDGEIMQFNDMPEAVTFLKDHGATEEDIYYMTFEKT